MFVPVQFSQVVGIEYPPHLDGDVVDKVVISTEVVPSDNYIESEPDWKEPAPEFFLKSSQFDEQEFADAVYSYQRNPPFKVSQLLFTDNYYFLCGLQTHVLS